MTATTLNPPPTYSHRLATPEDANAIAPLYLAFAEERAAADPTMVLKPNFDFQQYIAHLLAKPLSYGWVLEHSATQQPKSPIPEKSIVGFLFIYLYDEAPPPNLPQDLLAQHERETPFLPRRVGSVLGLYLQPEHRNPENIKCLAETALKFAEQMKVNDIDLLISTEQTGIQALLQRFGFRQAAVQYTKHNEISADAELPSLHPPHPNLDLPEAPSPHSIPLRDPQTNELVRNDRGEPLFLNPLADETGKILLTSEGMPIYPMPLRDPQQNDWVFDRAGELVLCPLLRDENGQIVEHQGIPVFHPPAYHFTDGRVLLKQDAQGCYVFCDVERDAEGKILVSPAGQPIFKPLS